MSGSKTDRKKRIFAILKLVLLLIIIAGIPAFLYFRFGSELFSKDAAKRLIAYLTAHQSVSALIIIALQTFQVVVCILPGQPIQVAASYMFGVLGGLGLSLIGAMIGVVISFFTAKVLGRDAVHMIFGEKRVEDYQRKLNSPKGLMIAFLIYLIPGVPKDLVSYAAGISEMRFLPFLAAATVGRIPGMAGSLLFGYFLSRGNYTAIIILCVVVAVILLIFFIKRKDMIRFLDEMEQKREDREAKQHG